MKCISKSLIGVAVASLAASAWAAEPWISVPSTPTTDQRLVVSGGDLAPGAAVTLQLQHPGGAVTQHTLNADAQGKLKFEYTLTVPGGYAVMAFDGTGKPIGQGRLGFIR